MKELLTFLCLSALLAGCMSTTPAPATAVGTVYASDDDDDDDIAVDESSSVTLRNQSAYDIYEIHLAATDTFSWGPDLLEGDTLHSGEAMDIHVFDCGTYDLRVVDDEGEECVIEDLDLCFDDERWVLDDATLAICTIFG